MVNGVSQLIMMKSDVPDDFNTIKACVAQKVNGEELDYFPYDITDGVEPVYAELPGDVYKRQGRNVSYPKYVLRIWSIFCLLF